MGLFIGTPADNQKPIKDNPMMTSKSTNLHPNLHPVPRCLGCDVGKKEIVIFDSHTSARTKVRNEPEALKCFVADLDPSCLIVCEATGGYENHLLDAAIQAGIPVHRADARKVKAFIRSFGTIGKTDAIDARGLARYGQERHQNLALWQPVESERRRLQALVSARRDMVTQRQMVANRLQAPGADMVESYLRPQLDCLDVQIAKIDTDIKNLIAKTARMQADFEVLSSISGIGPITAAMLIGLMPELGTLDRRQAAALAGLAPHPRQSGETDGYRRVRGGRPIVRSAMIMAGMTACRYNKKLKVFYERLIAAGKKPLVALVAVMRKLVVIANAKLRDARIAAAA
jgi:transposase